VKQFCAPGNTFEAPSTFPNAHSGEGYAQSHSQVMSALNDLHIIHFDVVVAKENFVSLRYTATGSHVGKPHNGIEPTKRKAQWTAAGNFILDEQTGLIKHWWKDWDKMQMWKQLGWVKPNNDEVEFA
jgi:predicted ester cyclase